MAQRDVCIKMGLKVTQCNADLSSCLEKKKRKKQKRSCNYLKSDVIDDNYPKDKVMEQNKIHNALKSNDSNRDLHESGSKPICSPFSSESVERADDGYVSEATEHDDHSLVDIISIEVGNIQTYQRKKRVKTYRRRKRDLSNSLTSSLLSIKGGMQDTSVQNSNEAPASGHSEKLLGEVPEYDSALLGPGDISGRRASGERPLGEFESGEQEKKMKVENLKEIINGQSVVQDIDTVKENFDKFTTFYKEDKASASSGSDASVENIESDNFEIRRKMRDPISSSSQVGEMTDNGAAAGNFRKKLLVLDVNGILADIVSCVSERYKPDTIISRKAVFKRPFCDDFLQFCFDRFRVGVWSSRTKRNMESILDFLMGKFKRDLLFCWFTMKPF
ncbi:hypothetical protein U1Q18_027649 [Sarracenia purpurea var. burkii]